MSDTRRASGCPAPERFFDLLESSLSSTEAAELEAHLAGCPSCQRVHRKARRILDLAPDALPPRIEEQEEDRLWGRIAPAASRLGQRQARRYALRVLAQSPYARVAAAAALVLILGAGLSMLWGPGWGGRTSGGARQSGESQGRAHRTERVAHGGAGGRTLAGTQPDARPAPRRGLPGHGASRLRAASTVAPRQGARATAGAPAGGARPHRSGEELVARAGRPVPSLSGPVDSRRPPPGRRLAARAPTPGISSALAGGTLACGARILSRRGVIRVAEDLPARAVLRLVSGAVTLKVPKRSPRRQVAVVTTDARVWVKGTRFTVRKDPGGTTTVSVAEGVVWVRPTGRARQTIVLGPGDTRQVQGEVAYLADTLGKMRQAALEQDLHQVVRLARRYLAVATRPRRGGEVRLALAGALEGLGRGREAVAQYLRVARSRSAGSVTRQNALAYLARYLGRRGQAARAIATWRRLLKAFPHGVHSREALLALLRASCRAASAEARRVRAELARRFGQDRAVTDALHRCRPSTP